MYLRHPISVGQSYFWPAVWFPGCHCPTFDGSWVAEVLLGPWGHLGMGTLLLQQLLAPPMWFPYTWAILSQVTFASALPGDGIWPQTPVGNTRSPPSCGTPSTSLHLGLLQFSAHSQSFLEGLYPAHREGVEIAHRWELTAGALTRPLFLLPWGNLAHLHSFPTFLFFTSVDFGFPLVGCLWPDFSQQLFFSGALVWTGIFSYFEFCILLSASCFPNPLLGWSAPPGHPKAVSSLHVLCQVHLLPLSGISSSFHCSCLQNSSLCRQQEKKIEEKEFY